MILDTPGLNAIGTEPELTLNLLPNAHAVLFILAADAGVTKTDIDVWTKHIVGESPASREGRLVILNKIDGLWDDLRTAAEIEAEIARQVRTSAQLLDASAGAGLSGVGAEGAARQGQRRRHAAGEEPPAATRGRVVEQADSGQARIVGAATQTEIRDLVAGTRTILDAGSRAFASSSPSCRTCAARITTSSST